MPHPDDFKMISEEEFERVAAYYLSADKSAQDPLLIKLIASYRKQGEVISELNIEIKRIQEYNLDNDRNMIAAICEDVLNPKRLVTSTLTPPRTEGEGGEDD